MNYDENEKFNRSSYRIAEKNSIAKYNFLNQNLEGNSKFQRGSNLRRSMPITERRFGDLSKPGTPVCSRRLIKKNNLIIETDSNNVSDHTISIVDAIEKLTGLDGSVQSEIQVNENVELRRKLISSNRAPSYPKYSSVPGTPVSSRHVFMLTPDLGEETFDELKKNADDGSDQLQEFIRSMEKLRSKKVEQKDDEKLEEDVEEKPTFGYSKISYNAPSILKRFASRETKSKTDFVDFLNSNNVHEQNGDDGIIRTYSGQLSCNDEKQFVNDDDINSNEHTFIKATYFTRTSYPLTMKELQSSKTTTNSVSNREKFQEILNKFKNMK